MQTPPRPGCRAGQGRAGPGLEGKGVRAPERKEHGMSGESREPASGRG